MPFLDEETGCYFGNESVKIKLIRRWNYENRIAAIVCRASTGIWIAHCA